MAQPRRFRVTRIIERRTEDAGPDQTTHVLWTSTTDHGTVLDAMDRCEQAWPPPGAGVYELQEVIDSSSGARMTRSSADRAWTPSPGAFKAAVLQATSRGPGSPTR